MSTVQVLFLEEIFSKNKAFLLQVNIFLLTQKEKKLE